MRLRVFGLLLLAAALFGCGGGGGGGIKSGGSPNNTNPVGLSNRAIQISWPARSRDTLSGVSSALSAQITISKGNVNGTDMVLDVDRPNGTTAVVETYPIAGQLSTTASTLQVQFYALNTEIGSVVATASASFTATNTNLVLANIALNQAVTSVTVAPATLNIGVGTFQLVFTALDAHNDVVAVSPGSAFWTIASGSTYLSLTPDGIATALAAGTASVVATVDGVASPAVNILCQNQVTGFGDRAIQITWPARSRGTLTGLSSALSAQIILTQGNINGSNLVVNANRPTGTAAITQTYPISGSVNTAASTLQVQFYALTAQTGSVVGTATATFNASDTNLNLTNIVLDQKVASVSATPATLGANTPTQLVFTAYDSLNNVVAVTPGSAFWSVTSGGTILSVTQDGIATATGSGSATVVATVDGVASPGVTISCQNGFSHVFRFINTSDTILLTGGTFGGACNLGSTFTVEAIVRPTAANGVIWQQWTDSDMNDALYFLNNDYAFIATGEGQPNAIFTTNAAVLNQWVHVAWCYDGNNVTLYQNGQLILTTPETTAFDPIVSATASALGRNWNAYDNGNAAFSGDLAAFRISNVVRYTGASFTPPTGRLSSDGSTLMNIDPSAFSSPPTTFTTPGSQGISAALGGADSAGASSPAWVAYTP